jgi:hypothetical protein
MSFRSTFTRARWLLLLLPLFALASTMQVGCTGADAPRDDFAHEDLKAGVSTRAGAYGAYGAYDDDDGYGYGYGSYE